MDSSEGKVAVNLQSKLSARDTPEGRRYEVKVALFHSSILILGCIGLALSFPPLIYLSAVGHLIANIFNAPIKWLGVVLEAVMAAVSSALLFAALYAIKTFYHGVPSEEAYSDLSLNWLLIVASAVVVAGIVGTLFAHAGNLDQLREHIDRT